MVAGTRSWAAGYMRRSHPSLDLEVPYAIEQNYSMAYLSYPFLDETESRHQYQGIASPRRIITVPNLLSLWLSSEHLRFPTGQPLPDNPITAVHAASDRSLISWHLSMPSQSSVQSVAVVLARNRCQSHSAPQPGPDGGLITPLTGTGGFSSPISRPSSSRLPSGKYS